MPEQFTGQVEVQTKSDGLTTIVLNGNNGNVVSGGNGRAGSVAIRDGSGTNRVEITPEAITIYDASATTVIRLDAQSGEVQVGATGARGQITVSNAQGEPTILIGGGEAKIELGTDGQDGDLLVRDNAGNERIRLNGNDGSITVVDSVSGERAIRLNGNDASLRLGRTGQDGDLYLESSEGVETIHLGGDDARIELGASSEAGTVFVKNDQGQNTIELDGQQANLRMGGSGADGDIFLFRNDGDISDTDTATVHVDAEQANVYLGGQGVDGDMWLFPAGGDRTDTSTASIHLDGDSGDIILQNADVAEDFDVGGFGSAEPGMVVVIGDDSKLQVCDERYDRRVAGVIAGGGVLRPGIVLGRHPSAPSRVPVALMGKVFCRVDATAEPIAVGDLLTTSSNPGHAMKASDPTRAFGSVIGKALQSKPSGTGTIAVLVALQ